MLALGSILRGPPGWGPLLSLVPTVLMLHVLGWSLATLLGLVTVRFRDTHHISELAFQALFYLTPVIYEPDLLSQRGLGWLLGCNPVVPFLTLLRQPVLYHQVPAWQVYAVACAIVLAVAALATLLLWREERELIFRL